MQRHRTMKSIKHFYLALTLCFCFAMPGYAAELTQRDWMITLVDTVGWSYGLPDEPQDPDYINILTGNRAFRFEAEDIYAKDEDTASVMSYRNFGAFSGRGWLHGSRESTKVHLRFTLPLGGEYRVQAHMRQAGHQFSINGAVTTVDAKPAFTLVSAGSFQLQAGAQEIVVTLAPGGSIDYITLKATNLASITPDLGWQPDEELTWEVIQTTLLQLLDLAEMFPASQSPLVFEAEELDQAGVKTVSLSHLGRPSGGKWLRAGPSAAEVKFPVKLNQSGFYDVSLRAMGNPINISIGGHQEIDLAARPYLDDYTFKSLFFFAGTNDITMALPSGGGVDRLILTKRQIDYALVTTLLGFGQQDKPVARDLDTLASLLAAFGVKR